MDSQHAKKHSVNKNKTANNVVRSVGSVFSKGEGRKKGPMLAAW